MKDQRIDREKFRKAIRSFGDEYIYLMLSEAIDMLPQPRLEKLAKHYLNPAQLRPDDNGEVTLLNDAKAFENASLRGEYFESFDVNWKPGTLTCFPKRSWSTYNQKWGCR